LQSHGRGSASAILSAKGQFNGKCRADTGLAFDFYGAGVVFDDVRDNPEADPMALFFCGEGRLKDFRQIVLADLFWL
jgi:hypothetical protein